jgi:hypothetical protein
VAAAVVDDDHRGVVADAPLLHRPRESSRWGDLGRDGIVGVSDVGSPVDVNGARDVPGRVLVRGPLVRGPLPPAAEVGGAYVAPDVDDAQAGTFKVVG